MATGVFQGWSKLQTKDFPLGAILLFLPHKKKEMYLFQDLCLCESEKEKLNSQFLSWVSVNSPTSKLPYR